MCKWGKNCKLEYDPLVLFPQNPKVPLLMGAIQSDLALLSLSPIVRYTMNTLPPTIMPAQQASLHRETPQVQINATDFHETKAETSPSQVTLCQGCALMTFPFTAKVDGSKTASNRDKAPLSSRLISFHLERGHAVIRLWTLNTFENTSCPSCVVQTQKMTRVNASLINAWWCGLSPCYFSDSFCWK